MVCIVYSVVSITKCYVLYSPTDSPSVQRFDVVPEESEEIETATLSALVS